MRHVGSVVEAPRAKSEINYAASGNPGLVILAGDVSLKSTISDCLFLHISAFCAEACRD